LTSDPFYIGYHDRAPEGVRRTMRRLIPVLAVLLVGSVALLVRAEHFDAASFDFGTVTVFEGVYRADPVPRLVTEEGSSLLLVGQGKFAAGISAPPGSAIRLEGTRIRRGETVMVEIVPATETLLSEPVAPEEPVRVRSVSLRGEIVEAKCFLGVMNPGRGRVHRACTRLCLAGGIPAMLRFSGTSSGGGASGVDPESVLVTGLSKAELAAVAAKTVVISGSEWAAGNLHWVEIHDLEVLTKAGSTGEINHTL
jgi:hypothetical protein